MKLKNFIVKRKFITLFSVIIVLGAIITSIFSCLPISKNQESLNDESNFVANAVDYTSYADDLVEEIQANIPNSYIQNYNLKNYYPVLAENQTDSKFCWAYSA